LLWYLWTWMIMRIIYCESWRSEQTGTCLEGLITKSPQNNLSRTWTVSLHWFSPFPTLCSSLWLLALCLQILEIYFLLPGWETMFHNHNKSVTKYRIMNFNVLEIAWKSSFWSE
jgi:hypothetical protein